MTFSLVIVLYGVMAFLSSLVLLSTHKRVQKKELVFLAVSYGITSVLLLALFFFKVTPMHFTYVFLALMALKPLLFGLYCREYSLKQAFISFIFSDIAGLAGAAFILIVPAIWDFVTSFYLILVTFLPPVLLTCYFWYKKELTAPKAHFAFVIYPVFSILALCTILYFGLTRGIFSTTAKVAMDPAVILPVAASAFLLFPALRAVIYKLRFKEISLKDALILFYAVDISGTMAATLVWIAVKLFHTTPA